MLNNLDVSTLAKLARCGCRIFVFASFTICISNMAWYNGWFTWTSSATTINEADEDEASFRAARSMNKFLSSCRKKLNLILTI